MSTTLCIQYLLYKVIGYITWHITMLKFYIILVIGYIKRHNHAILARSDQLVLWSLNYSRLIDSPRDPLFFFSIYQLVTPTREQQNYWLILLQKMRANIISTKIYKIKTLVSKCLLIHFAKYSIVISMMAKK